MSKEVIKESTVEELEYAWYAGVKYCQEQKENNNSFQRNSAKMERREPIPVNDYKTMLKKFKHVTLEMERAYQDGFNSEI